jgi:serine phosphatase RsbU (regulator of sigma subunit)
MIKTNKYIIVSAFYLLGLFIHIGFIDAQHKNTGNVNDSVKTKKYIKKARQYLPNDKKQATKLAVKSLRLSIENEFDTLEAISLAIMAHANKQDAAPEEALKHYIKAANAFKAIHFTDSLININQIIGNLYYSLKAYEKAADYYQRAYDSIPNNEISAQKINIAENLGITYYNMGTYDKSEKYFSLILPYLKSETDKLRTYYNLVEVYQKMKVFKKANKYNQKLLDIYIIEKDSLGMAIVLNNMGYNAFKMDEFGKAIMYFKDALDLSRALNNNPQETARQLTNIGICYQNLEDYENAVFNLQHALAIVNKNQNHSEKARIKNILANIYFVKGDLYNASFFSIRSIASAKTANDSKMLQVCYKTYSQILKAGNDYIKALDYYEKHLDIKDSLELESRLAQQKLARKKYDLEKAEKQMQLRIADEEMKDLTLKKLRLEAEKREQEIELLKREKQLQKSEKERILQALALSKERHEAEIREKEIKTLEQDKKIKELRIRQQEAEKKKKEQEIDLLQSEKRAQQLEIEKQKEARKRIQWILLLGSVIFILILFGFFTVRKKNFALARQKQEIEHKNKDLENKNEEILTQKELIEEKNQSITASIQYAKRIQSAVLPPESFIDPYFPQNFVLFKPKDIVSGDFYWGMEKDGYFFVAAADCTGHGVPGAFMSMLGNEFLNEIVINSGNYNAGQILDQLRQNVIKALKQKGAEGEAKDGMDMAISILSPDKKQLQFAGANNPLYLIHNNNLIQYKADRMPIGIHQLAGNSFQNHVIDIEAGDTIYMFSDGFADQFGGPKGKKYKYKPFQQLLLKKQHLSMQEQKTALIKEFEEWRNGYEQIDDVLVIGIKV